MTREELNTFVDSQVTNKTAPNSLSPINEGDAIKAVADYVDQQVIFKNRKITLTSAEILALFTTSVELVPAIPGKLLLLNSIYQNYTYGTTTYNNLNTCKLGYGTTNLLIANLGLLIYETTNANGIYAPFLNIASTSSYIGLPIVLGANITNPTDGDGTLDLHITYYEITL